MQWEEWKEEEDEEEEEGEVWMQSKERRRGGEGVIGRK